MNRVKGFFGLLRETFKEWRDDRASQLAAALAYYTVFSMAPLLLLVMALAGVFMSKNTVQGDVYNKLADTIGTNGANFIRDTIAAVNRSHAGTLATIVGIGTLAFGAAGVFGQLQTAMNIVWDVEAKPGQGFLHTIRTRLTSFALIPAIGFLLLVSLLLEAGLSLAGNYFTSWFPSTASLLVLRIGSSVLSFLFITFLFALIFQILPDVHLALKDVLLGAAFTALLFTIGRFVIGLYLGYSSTASAYGAAGSLIVILLWIYYSAQIVLFGAEFTEVYARHHGKRIAPTEDAIPLTPERRIQQGIPKQEQVEAAQVQAEGIKVKHVKKSDHGAARKRAVGTVAAALLAFIFGAAAGLLGKGGGEGPM